jgi:hypothetical protein
VPVAAYVLAFSVLAAIAVATARETYDVPLYELDGRPEPVARPAVTGERTRTPADVARV